MTNGPADDTVEIDIAAPPEAVWGMVADVTRMGEWSPECYRCRWLGGATGPAVGVRFRGWNRQKVGPLPLTWFTTNEVTEARRGEVLSFATKQSGVTWTYRFTPTPEGGTHVVESRTEGTRPLVAKVFNVVVPGRAATLRRGMETTLARLKATAEA